MAFRVPERPVSSTPNVTGDIEISAFDHVATITNIPGGVIPVASLPNIAAGSFLANITGGTTTPDAHAFTTFAGTGLTYTNLTGVLTWDGLNFRKNSAGSVFTRRRVNFIEGSNVTITVADDAGDDEVDVTIASTGGGGGGSVSRRTDFEIVDDFELVSPSSVAVTTTASTRQSGSGAWSVAAGSGSNGSIAGQSGESGRPGVWRIQSGAASGASVRLYRADTTWVAGPGPNLINYADVYRYEWIFRYNTNADGGYFITFADGITRQNDVGIVYDSNVDGNLRFRTASGGTSTETALTLPAQATWHHLAVELEPTEARCYINDVLVATHTTNLPTTAFLTPYVLCFTRTSAARSMDLDFFWLRSNTLSR